ncbi:MAG: helix-turn-helix domain-containing protein [Chloroflexota bacterium]
MPKRTNPEEITTARRLRAQGLLLKDIADRMSVSERTIRRWVHDVPLPEAAPHGPSHFPVADDRQWPKDWAVDTLTDLQGFDEVVWQGNLGLIELAQRRGNEYIPWYFRRVVETFRRYQSAPQKAEPWIYAMAGLPLLAEWLGVPECQALAQVIEKHEPWGGGSKQQSTRRKYNKEALPLIKLIENGIARAALFPPESVDPLFPITLLLRILAQWLPQFDKMPVLATIGPIHLGALFLLIFRNPKPTIGIGGLK